MGNRLKETAKEQANLSMLGAGRFNEMQQGRFVFYAERFSDDKQNMENLFILARSRTGKLPQLLTARAAYRKHDSETGDDFLVLVDGYRYQGKPGQADYRIMQFSEYGVRIDLPDSVDVEEKTASIPTRVLMRSADPEEIAELQWRIAMPVSVIVLLFLTMPLSRSSPRQGRYGRMVVAILLFVIYYNFLATAKFWVSEGKVPPVIGLWWVPILTVLLTMALLGSERLTCRIRRHR